MTLKLIKEVVRQDGNQRIYLEVPDGRKLPLPHPIAQRNSVSTGTWLI